MAEGKRVDEPTGTETVGHEWDGIEELNTPLPRWWLWSFYATVIWAVAYTVFFPAWPMLSRATAGVLGWSSRSQLERQLSDIERERAPILRAISATPTESIERDPKLLAAALEGGRAAFRVNCVQCHGSGAAGSKGYPNLNDDDWLWGGDVKSIEYSIDHGIRNPEHPETRMSQMPAFGRDGILQPNEISDLTAYVRAISGQRSADSSARRGGALYAANCAVCHGPSATGNRAVGAPNLRDAIWLYGGDEASVRTSIEQARSGVMPRWNGKLDPATRKMLAVYVHSLGGGEGGKRQTGSP